jgi:hypothetical protein
VASRASVASGKLERRVLESARLLTGDPAFKSWLASERDAEDGDLLVFNNSFLYRDLVKTRKAPHYLAQKYRNRDQRRGSSVFVVPVESFNADFKRWPKQAKNFPGETVLREALSDQLVRMGDLVFMLLGILHEIQCAVPLRHSLISQLCFDPSLSSVVEVRIGPPVSAVTGTLDDPERVWAGLTEAAQRVGAVGPEETLPDNLEAPFADAFERLQSEAHLVATLPRGEHNAEPAETLLGRMLAAVKTQVSAYETALARINDPEQAEARNEVLRIAYNFASEADKLLGLVVSICDLKPILLWCTIYEHFALAQAFRDLPWSRSNKKPSLARYREIIAEARNRIFHSLVPFGRAIEVDLEGTSLRAHRLLLFPEFGRRTNVEPLEYEDRELIEVLRLFTHTREIVVPLRFWERNLRVMRGVERLLETTLEGLRLMLEEGSR